jgi:RNA polymerase sigma-70 factor (ECF subfamily)
METESGFESLDEKEIILLATKDSQAFEYLYNKYFPAIYKYVRYRIFNQDSALEIVSNVFYKALKSLGLFKWRSLPFSSWLYRIAFNEICNYRKREKRFNEVIAALSYEKDNELGEEYYYDEYKEHTDFTFINEYLRLLPVKDQEVIIMRFFEKRSFPEIASLTGKHETTLRVNLYRTLHRLKNLIPKEVYDEKIGEVSLEH